jgi:hypothetical protein
VRPQTVEAFLCGLEELADLQSVHQRMMDLHGDRAAPAPIEASTNLPQEKRGMQSSGPASALSSAVKSIHGRQER